MGDNLGLFNLPETLQCNCLAEAMSIAPHSDGEIEKNIPKLPELPYLTKAMGNL